MGPSDTSPDAQRFLNDGWRKMTPTDTVRRAAITYKVPYITSSASSSSDAIIALRNRVREVRSIQERTGGLMAEREPVPA